MNQNASLAHAANNSKSIAKYPLLTMQKYMHLNTGRSCIRRCTFINTRIANISICNSQIRCRHIARMCFHCDSASFKTNLLLKYSESNFKLIINVYPSLNHFKHISEAVITLESPLRTENITFYLLIYINSCTSYQNVFTERQHSDEIQLTAATSTWASTVQLLKPPMAIQNQIKLIIFIALPFIPQLSAITIKYIHTRVLFIILSSERERIKYRKLKMLHSYYIMN